MRKGFKRLRRELGSLPRETAINLVVGIIIAIIAPAILAFTLHDKAPIWVLVLAVGIAFCVGVVRGASGERRDDPDAVEDKLQALEQQVATLGAYDTYAIHVRDALADVRRVLAHELPSFSLRDFIETGIFEPAHVLLQQDHAGAARGDIRFSILHPSEDGDDFVMADGDELFPAHGHRAESREKFRLPPRAQSGREYESMVSVPVWQAGSIDGVLNVIATRQDAFSAVDRTYVTLLASVIDVARTLGRNHP